MNSPEVIERLAAEIGEQVYIDIAKWHLYLNDAHLHIPLAEKIYPLMVERDLSEQSVTDILAKTQVKVGGGKRTMPLLDLIPMQCQMDLMDALEEFERTL
ncbi:DUF3181 family protein [filamentous cyanobacterium LEGE 11480]|uniref:DUF3181 family protein n=1 Tax=Romeriopsis navalis LEGE 11480 TaxID=2777977 RepID=A0A928Z6Z5_9CYAN|nr:DUF3181 family protein [Romeriopsis navalis]MBE9032705.1 DUF3181 family protein [Romeriopsis navalis LEGE 11480]